MKSLYEALELYIGRGRYPFHMPGHKGNPAFFPPVSLISLDLTELDETDNLHAPAGCIQESQGRIAKLYGADESSLLVNGSTSGLIAAVAAVCGDGDVLAVARNCHRAVFSAMVLTGAQPLYFMPDDWLTALDSQPGIKAMILTSPSYEGVVLDIEAIAKEAHARDIALIVDEAHGAHFPFHELFPKGALCQGADIVVHSFHKTLPAFSQSAAVHVKGRRVDLSRLRQMLAFVQTSSPSYLIMATTDFMLNKLMGEPWHFDSYVEELMDLQKAIGGRLLVPAAGSYDISKLLLAVTKGKTWADDSGLAFEMVTNDYVLAMTSVADTREGFARLKRAIARAKMDTAAVKLGFSESLQKFNIPEVVIAPREAVAMKTRRARLSECIGEVAGSFLMEIPPGIPLLAPGERITEAVSRTSKLDCEISILLV